MVKESVDVQLARVDERLKSILEKLSDAHEESISIREWQSRVNDFLSSIEARIQNVEKSLATTEPTIQEFITIKHKVAGAGLLGRYLWIGLGAIIGFVFSVRESIFSFLSKG